jgi:hypothetical protein
VQIRIEATELPGRACSPAPDFPGYENVHVGVQRKDRPSELLDLHPGDAPSAVWTLDSRTVPTATGVAFAGRYIQNRLGGRFIYLSWGAVDDDGVFRMFRRAKIMLDGVPQEVAEAAAESGLLIGRLGLTDAKGNPLCAAVRPPLITWLAGPAA